jgi:hypothetical protein
MSFEAIQSVMFIKPNREIAGLTNIYRSMPKLSFRIFCSARDEINRTDCIKFGVFGINIKIILLARYSCPGKSSKFSHIVPPSLKGYGIMLLTLQMLMPVQ